MTSSGSVEQFTKKVWINLAFLHSKLFYKGEKLDKKGSNQINQTHNFIL
jgi:hypothetical protein